MAIIVGVFVASAQVSAAAKMLNAEPNGWVFVLLGIAFGFAMVYFDRVAKQFKELEGNEIHAALGIIMFLVVVTIIIELITSSVLAMLLSYFVILIVMGVIHKVKPEFTEISLIIATVIPLALMIVIAAGLTGFLMPIIENALGLGAWPSRLIVVGIVWFSIYSIKNTSNGNYELSTFHRNVISIREASGAVVLILLAIHILFYATGY